MNKAELIAAVAAAAEISKKDAETAVSATLDAITAALKEGDKVQLVGFGSFEIKSVRLGKASMVDSYCYFDKGELWIRNVTIAEYHWGTCNNHIPKRDRKLLLNRKELNKLQRSLQDRGLTIAGLRMFLNERGLVKIVIGLARGRKAYDKREYLKENDARREMDKAMKTHKR